VNDYPIALPEDDWHREEAYQDELAERQRPVLAQPQHDLAGLEAHMALLMPVEELFVALHEYESTHTVLLLDRERADLRLAIQALALVVESLQNRP